MNHQQIVHVVFNSSAVGGSETWSPHLMPVTKMTSQEQAALWHMRECSRSKAALRFRWQGHWSVTNVRKQAAEGRVTHWDRGAGGVGAVARWGQGCQWPSSSLRSGKQASWDWNHIKASPTRATSRQQCSGSGLGPEQLGPPSPCPRIPWLLESFMRYISYSNGYMYITHGNEHSAGGQPKKYHLTGLHWQDKLYWQAWEE